MRRVLFAVIAALTLAVCSAPAQSRPCTFPELKPDPQNLSFGAGLIGAAPVGWLLGPEWFMPPHQPVYQALIAPASECYGNQQCATIRSLRVDQAVPQSFLYQDLDVTPHRGEILTYRAQVRVETGSTARLLVRIHKKDCSTTFRDDMGNHPIKTVTWAEYTIRALVAPDAYQVEFGMQLIGQGAGWLDQIVLQFAPVK